MAADGMVILARFALAARIIAVAVALAIGFLIGWWLT